jgi:hypothetical protein
MPDFGTRPLLPAVSIVLGAHADAYVAGLTGYRDPDGLEPWLQAFARATSQAADDLFDVVRGFELRLSGRATTEMVAPAL